MTLLIIAIGTTIILAVLQIAKVHAPSGSDLAKKLQIAVITIGAVSAIVVTLLKHRGSTPPEPDRIIARASFETYADDTDFGENVEIDGILFQDLGKGKGLFVNYSGDTKRTYIALQFKDEGMSIEFPERANYVEMELADFAAPITVEVFGSQGKSLEGKMINRQNSSEILVFRQQEAIIERVVLKGGNHEGGLIYVECAIRN